MPEQTRRSWRVWGSLAFAATSSVVALAGKLLSDGRHAEVSFAELSILVITFVVFLIGLASSILANHFVAKESEAALQAQLKLVKELTTQLAAQDGRLKLEIKDKDGTILATDVNPTNIQEIAKVVREAASVPE